MLRLDLNVYQIAWIAFIKGFFVASAIYLIFLIKKLWNGESLQKH